MLWIRHALKKLVVGAVLMWAGWISTSIVKLTTNVEIIARAVGVRTVATLEIVGARGRAVSSARAGERPQVTRQAQTDAVDGRQSGSDSKRGERSATGPQGYQ